jgi:hypothetical protein
MAEFTQRLNLSKHILPGNLILNKETAFCKAASY